MSLSREELMRSYPLPAYNFQVQVFPYLGYKLRLVMPDILGSTWSFADVSGLELAYENHIYRDGLSFAAGYEVLRGFKKPPRITLSRGIVPDRMQLAHWVQVNGLLSNFLRKRNLRIIQGSEEDGTAIEWTVIGAEPVTYSGSKLSSSSSEIAVETLELVAETIIVSNNLFDKILYL
jgi:phage tail-like protein